MKIGNGAEKSENDNSAGGGQTISRIRTNTDAGIRIESAREVNIDRVFLLVPAQTYVARFLETFM